MKDEEKKELKERIEENRNAYKKLPRKNHSKKVKITENILNNKFIWELKRNRLDLGLTQKQMADRLGLSYKRYSKFESGEMELLSQKLVRNLNVFGYNILSPDNEKLIY